MIKFTFITLFENLMKPYFTDSILGRATSEELIKLEFINPREFSKDKHKKVDEYMIGGGAGLLMSAQPLEDAIKFVKAKNLNTHIVFLTPAAKKFEQNDAKRLVKKDHICFICGRYEGFDERMVEKYADEVFCIGDFILTGGELPALCLADAISRNVSGVLGNDESLSEESFELGLLESPAFTKPNIYENLNVVSDFLKGNHAKIKALKNDMACFKTRFFRPDLYRKYKPLMKDKR
nr:MULTISPECIES: tRNA (guanosine(37)-N1)-methyltransferase TrmD [unclassified Campylobacter]